MRNLTQTLKPALVYLLEVFWQDKYYNSFCSPLYVANDNTLSQSQLGNVTQIWLSAGFEKRAKRVLGFQVLYIFKP